MLGPLHPRPPGAPVSRHLRGQARKGARTSGSARAAAQAWAPTSAQILPSRQKRQQQVAARRLAAGAQLPARLHGSSRLAPRLSGPELSQGPGRPRLPGPQAGVRASPRAAGRCARGPPWGPEPQAARRAERPGGGAAPRGGAGGSLRHAAGVRRLCAPLRGDSGCPDASHRVPGRGGRGQSGEKPGQGCPRALTRAPQLPAPRRGPPAEAWARACTHAGRLGVPGGRSGREPRPTAA